MIELRAFVVKQQRGALLANSVCYLQARKKRRRADSYPRKLEAAKTRQEKHKKLDHWLLSLQEAEEEKKRVSFLIYQKEFRKLL